MLAALGAALAAAALLFLAFASVLGGSRAKAAILASAAVVVGLFYGDIVDAVNQYAGLGLTPVAALPLMIAVSAVIFAAVAWPRIDFSPANVVLNGIALMIFVVPVWQIASYSWQTSRTAHLAPAAVDEASAAQRSVIVDAAAANNTPRQLFYFIFDRYGSQPVLADYYGFDNSDLVGFLKEKGFYVASNSRANYLKTAHSLASTFHMGYLDFLTEDPRSRTGDWRPLYDMLKDHRVGRFLKSRDHKFIQFGSWWGPTQSNPHADENHSFGLSEFNYWYLRGTIVAPIVDALAPDNTVAKRLKSDLGQCYRVPRQIEKIKEIARRGDKAFVFAHVLVPHDPYVFGSDGRCPSVDQVERTDTEKYVEQVRYANSLIKDVVSALLATDGPKPVIVIQSDEGPFPPRYRSEDRSWLDATIDELREKMGILNAFYFSDGDYRDLNPQVTSVNTFRIVFDKYFGTELKRLPERTYAFPDTFRIYDFHDITDVLRDGTD
ncbi:hypothetical protein [Bradyrhizobium icense]|uniref:hypothetical protein n=1 Tax=Bradyrhizobium icense TaxID=1274631 RepID=UPI0018D358C3|nr:hypothetical protein [Bradyrhizobium icense]